jgi:hypothetical protein
MITSVKAGKRSDRGWTPEDDQQLLDLFDAEASWPLIAITLERGVEEVKDRAGKLRHEIELGLKAIMPKGEIGIKRVSTVIGQACGT